MEIKFDDNVQDLREKFSRLFQQEQEALGVAWQMRTISPEIRRQIDIVCAQAHDDRRPAWKRLLLAGRAEAIVRGREPCGIAEAARVTMMLDQLLAAWYIMAQTQHWLIETYNNIPPCRPGIEQTFAQLREYMEKLWKILQAQKYLNVGSDRRELNEPIRSLPAPPIVPPGVRPSIDPDSPVLDRPWTDEEVAILVKSLGETSEPNMLGADAEDGPPGPPLGKDNRGRSFFVNPLVRLYRDGRFVRVWYPPAMTWQEGFLRDALLCRLTDRRAMTAKEIEDCIAEIAAHVPRSAAATSDQYAKQLIAILIDNRYIKEQVTKKYGHRLLPLGRGKSTAFLVRMRWAEALGMGM
jgi:hypothetical protein